MSILHPLRTVIPRNNAAKIIGAIWLLAGLASIPEPIFYLHGTYEAFQPSDNSTFGKSLCLEHIELLPLIVFEPSFVTVLLFFLISIEVNGSQTMNHQVINSNISENKSNEYSSAMLSSNVERNDTNSNYPNATDDVYYCAPSKSGTK